MPRVLVIFESMYGNTEAVARAITDGAVPAAVAVPAGGGS
jgi:flavodoxin